MRKTIIYIHGKGGNAEEVEYYRQLCKEYEIISWDYQGNTPWDTRKEFTEKYDELEKVYDKIVIIGNSIGAYFAMNALQDRRVDQALFISPIVDMEKLIRNMMSAEKISEEELQEKREIVTRFGEKLSWEYLQYVRNHPINWKVSTSILYGNMDQMTDWDTIHSFAEKIHGNLCVMEGGEHWFHTTTQLVFLSQWVKSVLE